MLHSKTVLKDDDSDNIKRTNEIGVVIPLLETLQDTLPGTTITVDALLTQRKLARFLHDHHAHYVMLAKGNQPTLRDAIELFFRDRKTPDWSEPDAKPDHGRKESRTIWTTTELNDYIRDEIKFPHVRQAFCIHRTRTTVKTGERAEELVYGVTSLSPEDADAKRILELNRKHWTIENSCHNILDTAWQEDKSCIRKGHGPDNTSRPQALRNRPHQGTRAGCQTNNTAPQQKTQNRLRLAQNDRQLSAPILNRRNNSYTSRNPQTRHHQHRNSEMVPHCWTV